MKLVKRIAVLTLQCLWFLAIALPILMYLERPPVSKYTKREIANVDQTVAPGEDLHLKIAASLSKECPGSVVRTITDASGRTFDFKEEPRPEIEEYPIDITVPLGALPGPAQYGAVVKWRCNWVQEWFPKEIKQAPIQFIIAPVEGQSVIPEQQGIYEPPPAAPAEFVFRAP